MPTPRTNVGRITGYLARSIHRALGARPVPRADFLLLNLSDRRARQLRPELHALWRLHATEPRFAQLDDRLRGREGTRPEYDDCLDCFSPLGVRHTDDSAVLHRWLTVDCRLNLV